MEFSPALIHLDPDRKSCIVKCLCFIVCLVCFIVWGVPTLCGGCQLRLANVEPSRLEARWGTCASLTSLGLYVIQRVICLRSARILFFFICTLLLLIYSAIRHCFCASNAYIIVFHFINPPYLYFARFMVSNITKTDLSLAKRGKSVDTKRILERPLKSRLPNIFLEFGVHRLPDGPWGAF